LPLAQSVMVWQVEQDDALVGKFAAT
jgi:hypothetical protein